MIDLNNLSITGVVGHIEQRQLPSGRSTTSVVIYSSDDYKDSEGNWVNRSNRIEVSFWGTRGDGIFAFLKKGDQVWCNAKVSTSVKEENGRNTYRTNFNGESIGKLGNAPGEESGGSNGSPAKPKSKAKPTTQRPKSTWSKSKQTQNDDVDVDDLDDLFDEE